MKAVKLPFYLELFKTGRGNTISNAETIWMLKHIFGARIVES